MKRKCAALLFALLLVVECFACQSEQDGLYGITHAAAYIV